MYPNVSFGNVINYTNQNFAHIKLNTSRIGFQSFQLVNEYNEQIDLNGLEWNITLLLLKTDWLIIFYCVKLINGKVRQTY